jgi:hypothetical protein
MTIGFVDQSITPSSENNVLDFPNEAKGIIGEQTVMFFFHCSESGRNSLS